VDIYGNNLDLSPGTTNATVVATLQNRDVYIPTMEQVAQPFIVSSSPRVTGPAGLLIRFSGVPGRGYNLQVSSNLVTWSNLTTIVCTSKTTDIYDANFAQFQQRYYRIQAAPTPPNQLVTLGLPLRNTNGSFNLPISGSSNKTFVVQTSTDLTNWNPVCTNITTNGTLFIPCITNASNRQFYRLWFP